MEKKDATERFHEHLDGCKQCRENPFELCGLGVILIQQAGKQATKPLDIRSEKHEDCDCMSCLPWTY